MKSKILVLALVVLGGCSGTEGGNPRHLPTCSSSLTTRGPFVVPSNAPGVPLELWENATDASARHDLTITVDGQPVSDWELRSTSGELVSSNQPLWGTVVVAFAMEEGQRVSITRAITCDDPHPHVSFGGTLEGTVGPAVAPPDDAGSIGFPETGGVWLEASDELAAWGWFVTAAEFRIDGEVAGYEGYFGASPGRFLALWPLGPERCTPCDGFDCSGSTWAPGEHELSVSVTLIGAASPPPVTSTVLFDSTWCSR